MHVHLTPEEANAALLGLQLAHAATLQEHQRQVQELPAGDDGWADTAEALAAQHGAMRALERALYAHAWGVPDAA